MGDVQNVGVCVYVSKEVDASRSKTDGGNSPSTAIGCNVDNVLREVNAVRNEDWVFGMCLFCLFLFFVLFVRDQSDTRMLLVCVRC